jgi:hypothetical protein
MADGCVHLLYNIIWPAEQLLSEQFGTVLKRQTCSTAGPSRTKSHLPGHFPPASQTAAVLGQPLAFGLIVYYLSLDL